MPARSTVVSVLSKRGSRGIEQLSATQLLQLSGRAGRRGLDTLGHVVLCHSNYEDVRQAYSMLLRPADAISSHFCVSYNTALRLLATRPLGLAHLKCELRASVRVRAHRTGRQLAAARARGAPPPCRHKEAVALRRGAEPRLFELDLLVADA